MRARERERWRQHLQLAAVKQGVYLGEFAAVAGAAAAVAITRDGAEYITARSFHEANKSGGFALLYAQGQKAAGTKRRMEEWWW